MEIYLEKAFIDGFFTNFDANDETHTKLRKFLKKASSGQLIMDIATVEDYERAAAENPLLEMLLESKIPTLKPALAAECENQIFYEKGGVSKVLFVESALKAENIETRFGCIAISGKTIHKAAFLFNSFLIPFNKPRPKFDSWAFMEQFRHPFNALLVTDNYLFSKKTLSEIEKQLDENLLVLLENLLPRNLKIDFHLTIIGSPIPNLKKDKETKMPDIQLFLKNNSEKIRTYISNKLTKKFDYPIKLTILIAPFHDRNILTNYAWINSGNSFTYFENRRLHLNTNLNFQPLTYLNDGYNPYFHNEPTTETQLPVQEAWESIRQTCKCLNNTSLDENEKVKYKCGDGINRLLN